MIRFVATIALVLGLSAPSLADSLYGNCFEAKGGTCRSGHRITTDWNRRTGVINAARGTYELDLGDRPDRKVTVFCDGKQVARVRVNGRTRLVIHCK